MLSPSDLAGKPLNLSDIGVSLFCQETGEKKKVIPGLSVLSSEVLENRSINPESVLRVLDKLIWVKPKTGRPFLITYISPFERRALACLAQGGFWSQSALDQTIKGEEDEFNFSEGRARVIKKLRKKLALEGIEISLLRPHGWFLRSRSLLTEFSPVVSKDRSLLDFFLERPGKLVRFEEIFPSVLGREFLGTFEERRGLAAHLVRVRKQLKEKFPQEDWHLATVREGDSLILCQGKVGKTIPLPGLYEYRFVPEWLQEKLRPQMEKGFLGENGGIVLPWFTTEEALILFRLARMPGEPLSLAELKNHLENQNFGFKESEASLKGLISRLRGKLKGSGIEVITHRGLGYALEI